MFFPANFTHFWVTATLKMQLPQIRSFKKESVVAAEKAFSFLDEVLEAPGLVQWHESDPGPMDVAAFCFSLFKIVALLCTISISKAVVHC